MQINCKICNKIFKHFSELARHIDSEHFDIGQVEYYKKYISNDPKCGICLICNKPLDASNTRFCFTRGFRRHVHRQCGTLTLEHWKLIYGDELGTIKWNEYCLKQKISNSYEYKAEKYGWTKEEFNNYNKNRAVTLENMIKRHGKIKGTKLFNEYCKKQKVNGCTKEYFINKYGNEIGLIKYNELNKNKAITLENFIKKYGKNDGPKKYFNIRENTTNSSFYSKISIDLFKSLTKNKTIDELNYIYFGNKEYGIYDKENKKYFKYDYTDTVKKIIIEFNGEKFHPKTKFDENFKNPYEPQLTSEEIWNKDQQKKECAIKNGFTIYYIWESDYLKNKQAIIETYLKII